MTKTLQLIIMILVLYLFQSCSTYTKSEREIEIEKIEAQSIHILSKIKAEISVSEVMNEPFWNVNTDSVFSEWNTIHTDSAELGLIYMQEFDSIYSSKKSKIENEYKAKQEKELAGLKRELSKLKKKFTYKKDDFKDIGFYTHKRWGKHWPNRKTLTSGVNSSGYAWLRSNYSGNDWLFHTSIQVLIGDKKMTSPTVETYSDKNIHDNSGGRIWEVITFDDTSILKEIAENINKKIKVRFNGREFHDDATLSSGDKQALKDCYELARLISKIGE